MNILQSKHMGKRDNSPDTSPDELIKQINCGFKLVKSRSTSAISPSTSTQPQTLRRKPWNGVSSGCTTPSIRSDASEWCSDDYLSSFSGSPASSQSSWTSSFKAKQSNPTGGYCALTRKPAIPFGGYPSTSQPELPTGGYRSSSKPATPTGKVRSTHGIHTPAASPCMHRPENVPGFSPVSAKVPYRLSFPEDSQTLNSSPICRMARSSSAVGLTRQANASSNQIPERRIPGSDKTQSSPESKMKTSMIQGVWTYISTVTKTSVKVTIEGDIVTWPEGRTAKLTCKGKEFELQFEGESDKYSAFWRLKDDALCWSDNAVWTRVTPLKYARFEDVIH
eukprot:gnl/MRDRNA2_/MRDRNA2_68952_c0_seq1.p1 gnl/MRDRNA2_/MRDRNA2_68952_c0~~gnl/MRDRNA2_/MRDRNA2_68952_c0_seq1.p1  ORF type:complete len:336 (+),score=37.50 gnl/MRDRNA2_/MRDRNA2_68952_c0_seq1:81-1088(+)